MPPREDALELLLPHVDPARVRLARDVTQFLRLLCDDAHPSRAASVAVDVDQARAELERTDRERLTRGLDALAAHYVLALVPSASFLYVEEPDLGLSEAWGALEELRDELGWLATIPEPLEPPEAVVQRLLASWARAGGLADRVSVWSARCVHVLQGPRAGERAYRAALQDLASTTPTVGARSVLVAGVAEALLDRAAVREARAWLHEHSALVSASERLRQLWSWTRLLLGEPGANRPLPRAWAGTLPSSLVELRWAIPEWLPCLAGRPARAVPARAEARNDLAARTARPGEFTPSEPTGAGSVQDRTDSDRAHVLGDRSELGASVFVVFAFNAQAGARPIRIDVAPGLRAGLAAWLAQREDAYTLASEREHKVVTTARVVVEHLVVGGGALEPTSPALANTSRAHDPAVLSRLRGALGGAATRAVLIVPALDDWGEVLGWIHLEFEHHLVPAAERSAELAACARAALPTSATRLCAVPPLPTLEALLEGEREDPRADVFRGLVEDLGIKTHQRLWWGMTFEKGTTTVLAAGGEGSGLGPFRAGLRRAIERSLATGGHVTFDEPDERLAVHADAASGRVVPLVSNGRTCGLLVLESSRRRDFRTNDDDACRARIERAGFALRVAQFRRWHREVFDFEPWFDTSLEGFRTFAHQLVGAAHSRSALVLHGATGVGKLLLARWFHFEAHGGEGPFRVYAAARALESSSGTLARALATARGGTLVLDDIDTFDPALQEEVVRLLESVEGDPAQPAPAHDVRIVATTRNPLEESARTGRLRPDLAWRLQRLCLDVPPLRRRRDEIVPLVLRIAARFAQEEHKRVPEFEDDALALLWRQPWNGNVRELENLIYKLVLLHPGITITAEFLERVRVAMGVEFVRKVPSRHPPREELLAALRSTVKPGGRWNKTRAALYLGWDPDTLVARLEEVGIREETFRAPSAWTVEGSERVAEPETDED